MAIELDHVFVCAATGAPEAELLVHAGFVEGSPNVHPGQGTANRRFSFRNAMLELLWVSDPAEARSEATRETGLWERWSTRANGASPFGICTRPTIPGTEGAPFSSWEYRPAYLPPELCLHVGKAPLEEPMWVHLAFVDRQHRVQHFVPHPNDATDISGLRLLTPARLLSDPARVALQNGVLTAAAADQHLLEIEIDRRQRNQTVDLRPALPVVVRL
jgi:Glyoxalase-like domain